MIDDKNTGVKSTLISGEAWDTTLQWMVNASDNKTTNSNYDINSDKKGWYVDLSTTIKRHLTGYYPVNNIYDMAGNAWEWTTENCKKDDINYITTRGGFYNYSGLEYPAAYRDFREENTFYGVGFRVVLYK